MLNTVVLVGRLAHDPSLRYTPNEGTPVTTFDLACERGKDKVDFLTVVVYGKQAESCAQYLSKGSPVAVNGSIATRSYTSKRDGIKRRVWEIVAQTVRFLPSGSGQRDQQEHDSDHENTEPQRDWDYDDVPF